LLPSNSYRIFPLDPSENPHFVAPTIFPLSKKGSRYGIIRWKSDHGSSHHSSCALYFFLVFMLGVFRQDEGTKRAKEDIFAAR
jgi:hypothetical protein